MSQYTQVIQNDITRINNISCTDRILIIHSTTNVFYTIHVNGNSLVNVRSDRNNGKMESLRMKGI